MKALEVKGLYKRYGDFALNNVNFSLEQGTITGLVGRNGAGKTTILRSILGAAHIDAGEISFLGRPIDAQTKQNIGVVYDACCFSEMLKIRQIDSVLGDIYHNWSQDVFLGLCAHTRCRKRFACARTGIIRRIRYCVSLRTRWNVRRCPRRAC